MKKEKLHVTPDPSGKITAEVMAKSIKDISEGMKALTGGRLKERAIVILLHNSCCVNVTDILKVLTAIKDLEKEYLN